MGWSLYTDRVERFVYISKLFTPSECDSIVKHGNKFSLKDATLHDPKLASKEKYSKYRDSKIYFLDSTNIEWVYERLTNAITDLNKRYFNFDLWGFGENMQFTKYISPGGKYDSQIGRAHV